MTIFDNFKKLFSGIFGKEPESNDDDVAMMRNDNFRETPKVSEEHVRIPEPCILSINLVDDDLVEERIPCVYGPPSWYNENGGVDRSNPETKKNLSEAEEIETRNRQRKELRIRLQNSIDKPIASVYGPDPTIISR